MTFRETSQTNYLHSRGLVAATGSWRIDAYGKAVHVGQIPLILF